MFRSHVLLFCVLLIALVSSSSSENDFCNLKPKVHRMFRIFDKLFLEVDNQQSRYLVYDLNTFKFEDQARSKQDLFHQSYGELFQTIISAMVIEGQDYYNHHKDKEDVKQDIYPRKAYNKGCEDNEDVEAESERIIVRVWGYVNKTNEMSNVITYEDFQLINGTLHYRQQAAPPASQSLLWKSLVDSDFVCVLPFGRSGTAGVTHSKDLKYMQAKLWDTEVDNLVNRKRQSLNMFGSVGRDQSVPRLFYQEYVFSCVELNHSVIFLADPLAWMSDLPDQPIWTFSRTLLLADCSLPDVNNRQKFYELSLYSELCLTSGLRFDRNSLIDHSLSIDERDDVRDEDVAEEARSNSPTALESNKKTEMFYLLVISFCVGIFVFAVLIFILLFVNKNYLRKNFRPQS